MEFNKKEAENKILELVLPYAKNLGLEILAVKIVKEKSDWFLRVFINKLKGIDISDCENLSKEIDKPLDDLDPIPFAYCLEVCSPGELNLSINQ